MRHVVVYVNRINFINSYNLNVGDVLKPSIMLLNFGDVLNFSTQFLKLNFL